MNGSMNAMMSKPVPLSSVEMRPAEHEQRAAALKASMVDLQKQMCLLLDETAALGLKFSFNIRTENGRHVCDTALVREY